MITCLQDEEVTEGGGLNPDTYWKNRIIPMVIWKDKKFTNEAKENCAYIVAITCAPVVDDLQGNQLIGICKSYIEAAITAKYEMVFIEHISHKAYSVKTTKNALLEFVPDPTKFVRELGNQWFFCKCKSTATRNCMGLTSYGS